MKHIDTTGPWPIFGHNNAIKRSSARALRASLTPAEEQLWKYLRANRLNGAHFRRQHVVLGFILDFYCNPAKLAVEIDGEVHEQQADYDRERELLLREHGIRVIRFTNAEVLDNIRTVLAEIEAALVNR